MNPLGRLTPPDFEHVSKYPLRALVPAARPIHSPVVSGSNWYPSFDRPVQDSSGLWHIGAPQPGESPRGGHCYCFEPAPNPPAEAVEAWWLDVEAWWTFYNQLLEGACVGFGTARALSLHCRKTFNAFWLYDEARREEGTYPSGEGSTVRMALQALVNRGAHPESGFQCHRGEHEADENPTEKITAYRWITTVEDLRTTLGLPSSATGAVLLNSWGKPNANGEGGYPHRTTMDFETIDLLLNQEGELAVFTSA